MRIILCKACVAFFMLAALGRAVELDKIERKIAKLPQFNGNEQRYCLLVFGPEGRQTRVACPRRHVSVRRSQWQR